MKRPATAPAAPGATVQLFPFLAVLLCTMGALVLLLVIFARQAALQAENQPPPEVDPQLRDRRDELAWRIEHLTASRTKTAEQLAEMRHTLSHAEDHARRLRDELAQAIAALAALDQPWDASRSEIDRLRRQRTQLDARRAQLERELAELDQRPAKGTSYAIVPHEGPNHTRRRPIYIECHSDRVVIQPEGIVFPESDFAVLGDPRNPLAAAVRAAAEKVVRQHQLDSSGMPYPLLLVRPDGIAAYYAARAALDSWDTDFGYECIEADWELKFPPADRSLAQAMSLAADDARHRQRAYAVAHAGAHPRAVYRAAPTRGGVVVEGGLGGLSDDRTSDAPLRFGAGGGNRNGFNRSSGGDGFDPVSGGGMAQSATPWAGDARSSVANAEGDGGSASSNQAPATADRTSVTGRGTTDLESLARTRGENWGLPGEARGATPVTRPLTILCDADRLVLASDRGPSYPGKVIALGPRTADSVDELVSAVWDQIEGWGIAGRGMYWKPVLSLQVTPEGAARFADLQTLLAGSGLEIRGKPIGVEQVYRPGQGYR